MIQELVDRFMAKQHVLRKEYEEKHPWSYLTIVEDIADILFPDNSYVFDEDIACKVTEFPTVRGHTGENTYVILDPDGEIYGYYLYMVAVRYGSCSSCDTLQRIARDCQRIGAKPTKGQTEAYMTLALHIVQAIKLIDEDVFIAEDVDVDEIIASADSTIGGEP